MLRYRVSLGVVLTAGFCACGVAQAEVVIETVTVGDPGNAGENSGESEPDGFGPDRICGAVDYTYNIGKYEVTNAQYAEFLNAVAADDPGGLYDLSMGSLYGGITRAGRRESFTYNPIEGRGNMPVNHIGWYDALRFANWMHNGQPVGAQDASTTEDGAYDMSLGAGVVRKCGARVFLPSEDEWYKAAYYKGGGPDAGYWDYPTQSDTGPTLERPPGTDFINGSANHRWAVGNLTDVGVYAAKPSDSAYGTYDQGGNVWEWNESVIGATGGLRGGSFSTIDDYDLHASTRYEDLSSSYDFTFGFRVGEVPEPGCDLDCDLDGDVDLYDFAVWQRAFTGPQ